MKVKKVNKRVLVWHLEALRLQLSDGGGQLGNRGRDVRQLDDAPLRRLCKLSQPCQVIRLSLFLLIKLKSQNYFAVTRQSKHCGFSIHIFDNSKSKSMVRLVRAEKMVLPCLVFTRKIARMISIQNV